MSTTTPQNKKSPILEIVENYLIPRTQQVGTPHTVVMPVQDDDQQLPLGARVEKCALEGERVPLKHIREAGQMSVQIAAWPQQALSEKNVPFFLCVIGGCATMQIGSQLLTCEEGTFVFIPPGLPHPSGQRPYNRDQQLCSILWLRRCGRGLRCWVSHSKNAQNFRPGYGETVYFYHEQLVHVFDALCDELMLRQTSDLYHHAVQLFLRLMQREIWAERGYAIPVARGQQIDETEMPQLHSDPVELATEYIKTHLAEPLTLEKIARHIHMSRASFARLFHQQTGQTFLEYLNAQRLQQACTYLRGTSWTINSIAELCGYASESGFHRFFLKEMGITPLVYRKQIDSQATQYSPDMNSTKRYDSQVR